MSPVSHVLRILATRAITTPATKSPIAPIANALVDPVTGSRPELTAVDVAVPSVDPVTDTSGHVSGVVAVVVVCSEVDVPGRVVVVGTVVVIAGAVVVVVMVGAVVVAGGHQGGLKGNASEHGPLGSVRSIVVPCACASEGERTRRASTSTRTQRKFMAAISARRTPDVG